jgi:hypothetical protein
MSQYAQFQKDHVARKWAVIEKASVSGGQRGIYDHEIDWQEYQNFLKWKSAKEFLGRVFRD